MQFTLSAIILALAAATVNATPVGTPAKCDKYAAKVPSCALPIIMSCSVENDCGPFDYTCGCNKEPQLLACALPKVVTACNPIDVVKAVQASQEVCKCAQS